MIVAYERQGKGRYLAINRTSHYLIEVFAENVPEVTSSLHWAEWKDHIAHFERNAEGSLANRHDLRNDAELIQQVGKNIKELRKVAKQAQSVTADSQSM
jgi:hypothetical protein